MEEIDSLAVAQPADPPIDPPIDRPFDRLAQPVDLPSQRADLPGRPFDLPTQSRRLGEGDRFLHSDPHDFAGLYIRHRRSFTLHARRYLHDQRDADEVVQEAFLRLFLALPELDTELQALAYCRRTITNLCIDRFRAQARRPHLIDLDSAPLERLAEDDPGDPVVRAEDAAMVRAALSLLSPLHRDALIKREIEEKAIPIIAVELDIPEESVKHLLFRARRAMRRILVGSPLAPGGEGQLSGALALAVSKGSLGVVALLVAAGLSTGPDLRSIPVVGVDLPDLPSVGELVRSIGNVLAGSGVPASDAGAGKPADIAGPGPAGEPGALPLGPSPTPTPSTATVTTSDTPTVVLPTPTPEASPSPGSDLDPRPSLAPMPTAAPSVTPSSLPSGRPSSGPSNRPSTGPSNRPSTGPSNPSQSPSSNPSASPSSSPSLAASSAAPKPSSPAAGRPGQGRRKADDPSAWNTPGLVWVLDPDTLGLILVPEQLLPQRRLQLPRAQRYHATLTGQHFRLAITVRS